MHKDEVQPLELQQTNKNQMKKKMSFKFELGATHFNPTMKQRLSETEALLQHGRRVDK